MGSKFCLFCGEAPEGERYGWVKGTSNGWWQPEQMAPRLRQIKNANLSVLTALRYLVQSHSFSYRLREAEVQNVVRDRMSLSLKELRSMEKYVRSMPEKAEA